MDNSLNPGDKVRINANGIRFLSDFFDYAAYLNPDGELLGTLVEDTVFPAVRIDGYDRETYLFGRHEVERYEDKPRISVTELVELLTTYRTSDNPEDVEAAQELLIDLFMKGQ